MNKAVKNFVSYLMITMLFILNLLPMMNAFAQEVTSDAEKTVEKTAQSNREDRRYIVSRRY